MKTRVCKYCSCTITGRPGEIFEMHKGERGMYHSGTRCLQEQVRNLALSLKGEKEKVRILELGNKNPRHMHARNLREIKALEDAVKANFGSATVSFAIVKHGWQCDIEVLEANKKPVTGSICRDWGDSGKSATRFYNALVKMAQTGKP